MKDAITLELDNLKDLIAERYGYLDNAVLYSISQLQEMNSFKCGEDAARQCTACNEADYRE